MLDFLILPSNRDPLDAENRQASALEFVNLLADRHDLQTAIFEWACEINHLRETNGSQDAMDDLARQIAAASAELDKVKAEIDAWRSTHR